MRTRLKGTALLALLSASCVVNAVAEETRVVPRTEHTFSLADGAAPPDDGLEAVSWLVGQWEGEAFGKRFEASWAAPSGGSMLGTFKLLDGDGDEARVEFSEILLLRPIDGRLTMRVKHFDAELVAWEEKDEFTTFRLVAVAPTSVHFSGLSFYRRGADAMDAYIVMRGRDDAIREAPLVYRRVSPTASSVPLAACDGPVRGNCAGCEAPWPAPAVLAARGLAPSVLLDLEGRVTLELDLSVDGFGSNAVVLESTARAEGVDPAALVGILDDSALAWSERLRFVEPTQACRGVVELSWGTPGP